MNESKSIFKSKTFWTNIAAVAGLAAANYTGTQLPVNDEVAVGILGVVNIFLRGFTSQPTHIAKPKEY